MFDIRTKIKKLAKNKRWANLFENQNMELINNWKTRCEVTLHHDTWHHTAHCYLQSIGVTPWAITIVTFSYQFREALIVKSELPVCFVQYYSTQKPGQRSADQRRQYSVGMRKRVKSTTVVGVQALRENSPGCKS